MTPNQNDWWGVWEAVPDGLLMEGDEKPTRGPDHNPEGGRLRGLKAPNGKKRL